MSERRSWDIQPNPRRKVAVARDPILTRGSGSVARTGARPTPLKVRRRAARRRLWILISILIVVMCIGAVYLVNRPALRIAHVGAGGTHADATPALALSAIQGSYFFIVPKDSIIFVSEETIRQAILAAFPDISAVSVSRTGLDSLYVNALPRVEAFAWCGGALASSTDSCYEADAEGYVFLPIVRGDASSSPLVPAGTLKIYAPLVDDATTSPIRSTVSDAAIIPDTLRFVRAIQALGANVDSLQLHDDEGDVYLVSGTRVTYIVGHEQAAADLAATAFPGLNLNDGSLDYVDLRFDGKVYYKKIGG